MFDPASKTLASPPATATATPPARSATVVPINSHNIKVACSNCNLRELCMPLGLNRDELEQIDLSLIHI